MGNQNVSELIGFLSQSGNRATTPIGPPDISNRANSSIGQSGNYSNRANRATRAIGRIGQTPSTRQSGKGANRDFPEFRKDGDQP
eukprot:4373962-Karenia_brevis.AAC.1